MRSKLESYFGFARKSGNLVFGAGTCEMNMARGKVKLLIIAEDTAENTKKKLIAKAESAGVLCRVFGCADELSRMTGAAGRNVFAVTDSNFAKIIDEQIGLE